MALCVSSHRPHQSNKPVSRGGYANELQATTYASGIKIVCDDAEASILRLELEWGHVEWTLFDPGARLLELEAIEMGEPMAHFDFSATTP